MNKSISADRAIIRPLKLWRAEVAASGPPDFSIRGRLFCGNLDLPRLRLTHKQHVFFERDTEPLVHDAGRKSSVKASQPSRHNRKRTVDWTCPICQETLTLTGYDNAAFQRKRHLKTVHNKDLAEVGGSHGDRVREGIKNRSAPSSSGICNQLRALQRLNIEKHTSNHEIRHTGRDGLSSVFKKTWWCTKCLARGTTRDILARPCNPQFWFAVKAKWWLSLQPYFKQKISALASWPPDGILKCDTMASFLVETRVQYTTSTKYREKVKKRGKVQRQHWRSANGLGSLSASAAPGKCNLRLQLPSFQHVRHRKQSERLRTATQWIRDLCADGDIEPNPGPSRISRKEKFPMMTLDTLKVWQININGWNQRGWSLIEAAEKQGVHCLLLQETRLRPQEASAVSNGIKGWSMYHQAAIPSLAQGAHGGVAVLVRQGLPSVRATSLCTKEGEFLRVTLPNHHICSIYRRGGLNKSEADAFDEPIAQDIGSLGDPSCLIGGDWNHEPLTSPWNAWALSFGGHLVFPIAQTTGRDDLFEPASTRWDASRCIDWGITNGINIQPQLLLEKWGDHKALHWTLPGPKQAVQPAFRLRPSPDLSCPKDCSKEDWMDLLEKVWTDLKQHLPPEPSWTQLCNHAERICTTALLRLRISRKLPRNSHKGGMPVMQIKTSHHRTRPEGPDSIKLARLRRLWRRMTAFHDQHISTCDLKRAILREASWFGCPCDPLSIDNREECFAWLSGNIKNNETLLSTKRIQNWKQKIQSNDQVVWKWLKRDKKIEPVQHILGPEGAPLDGEDLFRTIEQFWRRHWPTAPSGPAANNPEPQAIQVNPPDVPPITSWDLRRFALLKQNKAAGPDGWRCEEIAVLPLPLLDLFADFFNKIEHGQREWPVPLTCWKQVLIPKPGKDHSSLDNWRPISIGSAFYRIWSAVRVNHLQSKILDMAGSDVHGGVHGRGTHTALIEPLCELQRSQSLQANRIPLAQNRPALRYLGAADLTKAFDKLDESFAAASAERLGLPKHVVKAWSSAWRGQRRLLQMRHSCSNFWVSDIGNLPQGDPASPLGLLCCLVEALARIKNQFPDGPEFGKTLHRMYLDDRSWFCSRQSTCLQIARAWKTEAERLGLDESQNKAEFAVVSSSPAKARKELTEALQAENLPGRVVSRPKILGSRINTMRNESSSVKEETERLQRAKLASQCIQRLPLHRRKKLMFAKGAAVSLVATPVMQRLPTLLAMKTIQTQITKCGNGTKGHLARLLQGHTACLNFQAGKVTTLFTLLHSAENYAIRQAWSGSVCTGPVSLLRKWMKRQGWKELGRWQWSHPVSKAFLAHQGTPPILGHRKITIAEAHKDDINHWLRDAWRGHTWNAWLQEKRNHRAIAIGQRQWPAVRGSFDTLRTLLKKLPAAMVSHATAVASGAFCSQASFDGQHHGVSSPCWFCGSPGFPDFLHQAWNCPHWSSRPATPEDVVQLHLGWPSNHDEKYDLQVLLHLAAVRHALLERRQSQA